MWCKNQQDCTEEIIFGHGKISENGHTGRLIPVLPAEPVFGFNKIAIYPTIRQQFLNGFWNILHHSTTACHYGLLAHQPRYKGACGWLRAQGYITDEICDMFGVFLHSIQCWQNNVEQYSSVIHPQNLLQGCACALNADQ